MSHVRMAYSRRRAIASSAVMVGALLLSSCRAPAPRDHPTARQYVERGALLLDAGLTDAALEAFTRALEHNPRLVQAHLGIGAVHRAREDYPQARRAYEAAVALEPGSFDARYYLGVCLQLLEDTRAAIRQYLQALAINPDSAQVNRDLAAAYLQDNRPEAALPYARQATELDRDDQSAWANLGATYSLLGRYERAVEAYRQAIELGDMHDAIVLGLADAHVRLGNLDRARNTLEAVVRQDPRHVTAQERLGFIAYKKRQYDEALYRYRTALSIDARDTAALNGLGVTLMTLYIQSGRTVANEPQRIEALSSWRRSLSIDENQPRILELVSRYQRL